MHPELTKLTERSAVDVNMLDDIDVDLQHTQVKSANTHPVYRGKVTKEELIQQHATVIQQDPKSVRQNVSTC